MIIGITGKSGSGKTFYSEELNKNNEYLLIDMDTVTHNTLKKPRVIEAIGLRYGEDILSNGNIDTKRLGEIVFSTKESIDEYNNFIWQYIKVELDILINTDKDIIIDWSLLPLSEYFNKCDVKVLIKEDLETRRKRVIERDNISEKYFIERERHSLEYIDSEYDFVAKANSDRALTEIQELIEKRRKL